MNRRLMAVAHRVALAGTVGWIGLLAAPSAEAQHWGRPDAPRKGACFYRDASFQGDYFCANAGQGLSSLPDGMNDQISSIRTFGDVEIEIFQDGRFHGRSTKFRGDVRNLRDEGWNDRLSSLRVVGYGGSSHGYGGSGSYHGDTDAIVRRAYRDVLNRKPDADGLRLYSSRIVDDGWSEQQVREALRESPEYREQHTMTREKAEEVVAQAYRSVLGRDADAGSRGYVDKVLHSHWSEQDVARELRKTPEYRSKHK